MELEDLERVPLFPLPNVVLLPAGVIPLHVFEARYCNLVEEALESNQILALPQLAPGWEPHYHSEPPIYPVFGLGRIIKHEQVDGDRFNILVEGLARVRLLEESLTHGGYRKAVVSLLEDQLGSDQDTDKAIRGVKLVLGQLVTLHPNLRQLSTLLDIQIDPITLADTLAHALMSEPEARQAYIECNSTLSRIQLTQSVVERLLVEIMSE